MHDLADFQRDFSAALFSAEVAGAAALAVHRNSGARAAIDALAANYPVVRALFGEEPFAACARSYLQAHPPRDPRLSHVGASFAAFLGTYPSAGDLPWIGDVAALEHLWLESLFAADAVVLDGEALLALGLDDGTKVALHPATRFAQFASPAASIWRAHDQGDPGALETIDWRPEAVIVTRHDQTVGIAPLSAAGLAFVGAIAASHTMVAAAEAALAVDPGLDLSAIFGALIDAGTFTYATDDGSLS
ncbi:MAG: putative DNA-binding domain-containing protein [Sphingomonas sp.]|jgi:hypothetical protein|uniref:HvfC/BufC family peptide modification chaperone n=1 Tax=Sphingomonas sp. TaxID=28214 RepID=UPI0035635F95